MAGVPAAPAAQTANVNVIFHGLFVFVLKEGYIDVLIPTVDDHSYRAGPFLAEETLMSRPLSQPYALAGVTPGKANFDLDINFFIGDYDYDTTAGPDRVYARIVLPYPKEIVSLRPTKFPLVVALDPGNL